MPPLDAIANRKSLPEQVYERLVEAISNGSLQAGERLTQEGVARELDVSRLPVHEAFQRLEADGFVCRVGRRGLKVAPLGRAFVRELYEFRAGIDQVAAGLAARNADANAAARGKAILAQGRAAVQAHDIPELIRADMAFHQLIYDLAGNGIILDVMGSHWNHTRRVMQRILIDDRHQAQVWRDHQSILDAVTEGRPDNAEACARAHVERAAAWLEQELTPVMDHPGC